LLKRNSEAGKDASALLREFDETALPVYAIKEFHGGPLKNFIWFYNKLAVTNSYAASLRALQRMAMTPRRYTVSTALEALTSVVWENKPTLAQLTKAHGDRASLDSVLADSFKVALKVRIMQGWRRRRSVTTHVVEELSCYKESDLNENDGGVIVIEAKKCEYLRECSLAPRLRLIPSQIALLRDVVSMQGQKPENVRRLRVLRHFVRTPKRDMDEQMCRDLGDAYFALFGPKDAVILSTNVKDLEPLAASLKKTVQRPQPRKSE
jgi:hypothetical protein